MKGRGASRLAWMLCGLITVSMLLQAVTNQTSLGPIASPRALTEDAVWGFVYVVYAVVAALIVSRQPRNLIGWLLFCAPLAGAIPAGSYIKRFPAAPADPTPLLLAALWFSSWSWLLLIFPSLFILLLFPTGRPPSARWRWLVVAGLAMGAFLILFGTFSAELGPNSDQAQNAWTVPNPIGFLPEIAFPMELWVLLLGILTVACAASLVVRYRHGQPVERAQIRWLLYACATFVVVYVPGLVLTGLNLPGAQVLLPLLPISLVAIPIAIAVAILRYHLWDIDVIIRRTMVYVPLTAILAGILAACAKVSQALFGGLTGAQSQVGTVLTTLIVVAAFDPIKGWLQRSIDARFKETSNPVQRWNAYGEQVRAFVEINDPIASAKKLLAEAVAVFEAKGGAVYLERVAEAQPIHTIGDPGNAPDITIPLEHQGVHLGRLSLAVRRNGRPYDARERELLAQNAGAVAAAIAHAGRLDSCCPSQERPLGRCADDSKTIG